MTNKKKKLVPVKIAIEYLGMTRCTFYVNHYKKFTKQEKIGRQAFLDVDEVKQLKKDLEAKNREVIYITAL